MNITTNRKSNKNKKNFTIFVNFFLKGNKKDNGNHTKRKQNKKDVKTSIKG